MSPAELTELTAGIVTSVALVFASYHILHDVFMPQAQRPLHTPNWGPHCTLKSKPGDRS